MARDPQKEVEIKKNFTTIISLLSQIASYSKSTSYNLNIFTNAMNMLFLAMDEEKIDNVWISSPIAIELACNYANSVRFDFTKNGIKITFPKINLNFGAIFNK